MMPLEDVVAFPPCGHKEKLFREIARHAWAVPQILRLLLVGSAPFTPREVQQRFKGDPKSTFDI